MKITWFVSETDFEFKTSFNKIQLLLNSRKILFFKKIFFYTSVIDKALKFIDLEQFEFKSRDKIVSTKKN